MQLKWNVFRVQFLGMMKIFVCLSVTFLVVLNKIKQKSFFYYFDIMTVLTSLNADIN